MGFAAARAKLARAKGESKKLYKVNNPTMGVFVRTLDVGSGGLG